MNYLLFPNLTHKIETGKVSETVSTMVTHLDQSNHQGNQKHMLGLAVPFANLSILCTKKILNWIIMIDQLEKHGSAVRSYIYYTLL
jgi:hypothetical protein